MLGIIKCDNYSFLLPLKNCNCLLSYWYMILNDICSNIIIIIDEKYKKEVHEILGDNIKMIDNIYLIKNEEYDICIYVNCENIIDNLNYEIIKKIKDKYLGGVLSWNNIEGIFFYKKEIENILINNDYQNNKDIFIKENIPGLLWNSNNFNDYKNYLTFLSIPNRTYIKGTLIIVALYIGNIEEEKINISLNCLINLRKNYPNEFIIIVDNNSYNKEWINLANMLSMYIIKNTSDLYRYEIGAYNLALKYFKADKYICIQHNINFHSKIYQELSIDEPDAYVFNTTTHLNMSNEGLNIINKYLNFLNMKDWNNEPLAIWNCFYCNDLMMDKIINSGLFDLFLNNKYISEVYERLLGTFLFRNLGNVKIIDNKNFDKIFFNQS